MTSRYWLENNTKFKNLQNDILCDTFNKFGKHTKQCYILFVGPHRWLKSIYKK